MIFVSAGLGCLSSLLGIYLSYYLDVASGAAIILVATALFFAVFAARGLDHRLRDSGRTVHAK